MQLIGIISGGFYECTFSLLTLAHSSWRQHMPTAWRQGRLDTRQRCPQLNSAKTYSGWWRAWQVSLHGVHPPPPLVKSHYMSWLIMHSWSERCIKRHSSFFQVFLMHLFGDCTFDRLWVYSDVMRNIFPSSFCSSSTHTLHMHSELKFHFIDNHADCNDVRVYKYKAYKWWSDWD